MRKKRIIASILAVALPVAASANISSSMQSWFDDVGAYGNVTGEAAYRGQTQNTFTGGSLYMRMPVRNHQLASVTLPSAKGGCGGIDLTAGSFSFINAEKLTALLRNVANNALGYAFMLAVEEISPQMANLLKYLQDQAAKINNMNIGSCEAAQGIVKAAQSAITDIKDGNEVKLGGSWTDMFPDSFSTWEATRVDKAKAKEVRAAAKARDPNSIDTFNPGNIVWKALQRMDGIDDQTRELMMSLTGTIIITPPGEDAAGNAADQRAKWEVVGDSGITFKQFVGDGSSTTETIRIIACADADCLITSTQDAAVGPFGKLVGDKIKGMTERVATRSPSGQDEMDPGFIGMSSLPVWKMIALSGSMPNGAVHVENYTQLIAVDIAHSYFSSLARELRRALAKAESRGEADVSEAILQIRERLDRIDIEASALLSVEYQKAIQVAQLQQSIRHLDLAMKANMPTNIFQSMALFNR